MAISMSPQHGDAGWRNIRESTGEFIENYRIDLDQLSSQGSSFVLLLLLRQPIHQIHGIKEADPLALMNSGHAKSGSEMRFTGAGTADQDEIMGIRHKSRGGKLCKVR